MAKRSLHVDRRTVLKGLGAAALVPGLACERPPVTGEGTVTPALLRERIKTVVVLMMENRSFDHVFGSYSLLEGRDDVDGLSADMSNKMLDGSSVPIFPADVMCLADDPAHGYDASHEQFNGGACDNFVRVHEDRYGAAAARNVMGYLDRTMAPASYALADRYALCQRWFASVMGPTWPNRYYSLLASSNNIRNNSPVDVQLPSIFARLDAQQLKWKQYYGNLPFSMLLRGHSLEQAEYQRLDTFFDDAAAGTLPSYVHLDPIFGNNDDHPPAHPMAGQILIASIYAALAQSPQWNECLFVVTYDEHGGFFDHVAPPTTADVFPDFEQMGFRVPTLVCGPYVKPQVSSTVFDHTSTIASVLRQHELPSLNVRDEAANDVWSLLDAQALVDGTPEEPIVLDPIVADDAEIHAEQCDGLSLFHTRPGTELPTGQPELEAFAAAHYPQHELQSASQWARVLLRARELGVIR
jgi:phospholipase C